MEFEVESTQGTDPFKRLKKSYTDKTDVFQETHDLQDCWQVINKEHDLN